MKTLYDCNKEVPLFKDTMYEFFKFCDKYLPPKRDFTKKFALKCLTNKKMLFNID